MGIIKDREGSLGEHKDNNQKWEEVLNKIRKSNEPIKTLLEEIKEAPLCYDDGITENEDDGDVGFIKGQDHFKEHIEELLQELLKDK